MYRHFVTIGSSEIEVFPLNFLSTQLVDEKERDQIFYRRKFSGTLTFLNNKNADDFELFYMVETVNPCDDILYEIRQRDSGASTYHVYWNGHFSTTDGRFDLDQCNFQITPKVVDNYDPFILNGDIEYNILSVIPIVTTSMIRDAITYTYTRNRWLIDVIEYIADQIVPGVTVASDILTGATNYVTGTANKYNLLTIAQKSDIKRPTSTNSAITAPLSWNGLINILKSLNLFYRYDGVTMRIEHISYWDAIAGIDLRTQKLSVKSNKYLYTKEDMPRFERFSNMEGDDPNFTTGVIFYDSPCVNQEAGSNEYEYSNNVTTDIEYIQDMMAGTETVSNISDEGFVIFANYLDGATYKIYYSAGYDNYVVKFNMPMSWSALLRTFFMHNRVMMSGYINQTPYNFISERKTKQQEIKAVVCYEDGYDPLDYITTELGESWFGGQKGYVKTASIKPSGEVTFSLLYGADTNAEVEIPSPPKIMNIFTTIDNIYIYLSEPSTFDTYLWIYIDSTTCQAIVIPSGTTYFTDALDEPYNTTMEFNLLDPSLNNWNFTWNGGPLPETGACPAVPDPPPAAPAISSINQPSPCADVIITWTASAGATYYKLDRNPDGEMYAGWNPIYIGSATHYDDVEAGNTGGTLFTYRVRAGNISGESANSAEDDITPICP